MKPLVMQFKVEAGGKTYQGTVTVPDDDGTSTLPMMVHSLIKLLAEDMPELHQARRIHVDAFLQTNKQPNHERPTND